MFSIFNINQKIFFVKSFDVFCNINQDLCRQGLMKKNQIGINVFLLTINISAVQN